MLTAFVLQERAMGRKEHIATTSHIVRKKDVHIPNT
jgi:hypothetical protein